MCVWLLWAELCPWKYVEALTSYGSQCDFIWRWSRHRGYQVKVRSLGWAVIWHNHVLKSRGKLGHREDHVGRHRERMESISQQVPRLMEVRWEAWNASSFQLRRNQPCQHLDFRLLASRTRMQQPLLVKSSSWGHVFKGSVRKLMHGCICSAQAGCMRHVLGPGALGRPRGIRWRGRWEGGSGWGIHVNPWLIHVSVWQKPLQYCKVISLQLIKINGKK